MKGGNGRDAYQDAPEMGSRLLSFAFLVSRLVRSSLLPALQFYSCMVVTGIS